MKVPVVTRWGSWRIHQSKAFRRFREDAKDVLAKLALWRKTIHKIGGHFGGGVQSYFLFLRFLVILNLLSFLLMASFVIIPSIVFNTVSFSGSSSIDSLPSVNMTGKEECLRYDPNPEALTVFYTYFLDLLSGTGFMEYSYMFYGFYNNTLVISSGFSYNIPLAYLLTAAFYFLFCLACIIVRSVRCSHRLQLKHTVLVPSGYSMLIFTGWDYGLQGERATQLKQNNLLYQLQVDLEEERIKQKAASLTLTQTVGLYSFRIFLHLVVLAMIVGAFFGIAAATQFSQVSIVGLLLEYLPSIVMTTSNFVVPFMCDQVARFEKYSPSVTIILALLRAVILRLVSLAVLLYSLWKQITCDGDVNTGKCTPCSYNSEQYQCWETRVGQEMYKLTLFDFLITIAMLVLVEFPRRFVVDNCSCKLVQWVGRQEFLVPSNILALVYGQTVVWAGALFCPLLPIINTIKFIIIFYCKKGTLFQNCRPALRTFRSTSSNFFFFLVLLIGLMLASVVLIYSVAIIHPSYDCGPFRFSETMWLVVPNTFHSLSNTTQEFLFYAGSQAFSIPLFIFSWSEGRDKQFLVKQIKEIAALSKEEQEPQQPPRSQAQWNGAPHWGGQHNPAFDPDTGMMTQPRAFFPDEFENPGLHYREE
uniref:Transmembrane channel-like protein n=1 Tax=Pygocentrus nattereri TaxID=42514 RepID=A0A3B4E1W5_PYGNA